MQHALLDAVIHLHTGPRAPPSLSSISLEPLIFIILFDFAEVLGNKWIDINLRSRGRLNASSCPLAVDDCCQRKLPRHRSHDQKQPLERAEVGERNDTSVPLLVYHVHANYKSNGPVILCQFLSLKMHQHQS